MNNTHNSQTQRFDEDSMFFQQEQQNTRLFKLIDKMHLQTLDETIEESSSKVQQIITNLKNSAKCLSNGANKLNEIFTLQVQEEQIQQQQSKAQSFVEKQYTTSYMQNGSLGEQPKLIKVVVSNQNISLIKIKELITNQKKIVDSLENSLREIVSKIQPEAIGALNVKGKQPLEELFELLFELLYQESKDKFQWKNFKHTALLKEEGSADLLKRMANFDLKELTDSQVENIDKIKDSHELKAYLEDPRMGEQLIDIADWLQFIFYGNSLMKELTAIEELYSETKERVEIQERNQRKESYINSVKEQRQTQLQSQQKYLSFVADKLSLIKENCSKMQSKINSHITYQSDVIATLIRYDNHKSDQSSN